MLCRAASKSLVPSQMLKRTASLGSLTQTHARRGPQALMVEHDDRIAVARHEERREMHRNFRLEIAKERGTVVRETEAAAGQLADVLFQMAEVEHPATQP